MRAKNSEPAGIRIKSGVNLFIVLGCTPVGVNNILNASKKLME